MTRNPVLFLFFLSGATGLLYQVVWVRLFSEIFGATVLAISTVLGAFMAGLALGGLWGGRAAARFPSGLRAYGVLELALAPLALLVPVALRAADPLYAALYPSVSGPVLTAVRFVVSAAILIPPTFLMGATLPVLTREAERGGGASRRAVARLYAVNTFGAIAGTVGASFVLLPGVGVSATLYTGVALNVGVGLLALALARRVPASEGATPPAASSAGGDSREIRLPRSLICFAAGTLGFSALAFEILWTRTLALALGTTTYAFAIVLSVFLLGIAGGSSLAAGILRRTEASGSSRHVILLFAAAPGVIGLLALGLLPVFDRLPDLFVSMTARGEGTWTQSLLVKFVLAGLPLLPPTLISGAAFPLAVAIDRTHSSHRSVGDVYASNTLGAILGSWAAGFVILPLAGLQGGIEVVAAAQVAMTCLLLTAALARPRGLAVAGGVAIVAAGALFAVPAWQPELLTRGGFVLGSDLQRTGQTTLGADEAELVFLEEGITSTVTVRRKEGEYTMQMNGVTEASTSGDLSTQVSVAALPLLFHPDPKDALVIGLGGGITAATVARLPTIESIECVEISEAVVHGAAFFDRSNRDVLKDPRLRLIIGDGRNHVALTRQEYDVIISLPSHVWNAGIGALMTEEFYRLCRARLRPAGILCTWIQGYSVSPYALRSVLAAVSRVFPRVSLWRGAWGDLLIVAGDERLTFDVSRLLEKGKDRDYAAMLREADAPDVLSLLSLNLLTGETLRAWVGDARPNTDDRPVLEFVAPKLLYEKTMRPLFEALYDSESGIEEYLARDPSESSELPALVADGRRARALESEARLAFLEFKGQTGIRALEQAHALLPAPSINRTLASSLVARSRNLASHEDVSGAARMLQRAIAVDATFQEPYEDLAGLYLAGGDPEQAVRVLRAGLPLDPDRPSYRVALANALLRVRQPAEARDEALHALRLDPRSEAGHGALAEAFVDLGEPVRAESVLVAGLELHPGSEELTATRRKVRQLRSSRP